jgi:hypothetical protein
LRNPGDQNLIRCRLCCTHCPSRKVGLNEDVRGSIDKIKSSRMGRNIPVAAVLTAPNGLLPPFSWAERVTGSIMLGHFRPERQRFTRQPYQVVASGTALRRRNLHFAAISRNPRQ